MITNTIPNKNEFYIVYPDGQISKDLISSKPVLDIVPGSFNPLHGGHRKIFDFAKKYNTNIYYEISVSRIDKDTYSLAELNHILSQFAWYAPVIVTNAARFIDKVNALHYVNLKQIINFNVGFDTAKRLIQQEQDLAQYPCYFTVYPRGEFNTKEVHYHSDLPNPPANVRPCDEYFPIDSYVFESSSFIRERQKILDQLTQESQALGFGYN